MGWFSKSLEEKQDKLRRQLCEAVLAGSAADVKKVLSKGAKPTALMMEYAVQRDGTDILKAMIEGGADVNAVDEEGKTPLIYAAMLEKNDWKEKVQLLLQKGAQVNLQNKYGDTALMRFAQNGKDVQVLLNAGADATLVNSIGLNALFYAVNSPRVYTMSKTVVFDNIKKLAKLTDLDYQPALVKNGRTVLMAALPEFKDLLVMLGANIHKKDKNGQTVLHILCQQDKAYLDKCGHLIKTLLEKGLSVDEKDNEGNSPLMIAAANRRFPNKLFDLMLPHSKNIDAADSDGRTLLMTATFTDQPKKVYTLLNNNASVWLKDKGGQTALDLALGEGVSESVQNMLKKAQPLKSRAQSVQEMLSVIHSLEAFAEVLDVYCQLDSNNQQETIAFMRQKIATQKRSAEKAQSSSQQPIRANAQKGRERDS